MKDCAISSSWYFFYINTDPSNEEQISKSTADYENYCTAMYEARPKTSCDERLERTDDEFNQKMLDAHNRFRTMHGVPPLNFDSTLAEGARQWIEHLVKTQVQTEEQLTQLQKQMEHPYIVHAYSDKSCRPDIGENIFSSAFNAELETGPEKWYSEVEMYDFENPGFQPEARNFTQMIWKDTCKLGCHAKAGFLVCRYGSEGNVGGETEAQNFEQNVPRAI